MNSASRAACSTSNFNSLVPPADDDEEEIVVPPPSLNREGIPSLNVQAGTEDEKVQDARLLLSLSTNPHPAEEKAAREGVEEQEQPDETEATEKEEEEAAAEDEGQLIYQGMTISCPHLLLNLGQKAHQQGGYKRSEFKRDSKGDSMTSQEMKDYFGFESFIIDGVENVCPRRGKFFCSHQGCLWNVAWSFKKAQRGYIVLDGPGPDTKKYNTNLYLTHNHEQQCTAIDGVTEVKSSKDLTEDEKDFLRFCAIAGLRYVVYCVNRTCSIISHLFHSTHLFKDS